MPDRIHAWLILTLMGTMCLLAGCTGRVSDEEPPATHGTARPVGADAGSDASDLLPNGRRPFPDILTGGQPTLQQLETAVARGYRTVINLRPVNEGGTTREDVEGLGMSYVLIPVAGAEGLTIENTRALNDALRDAERPVIVHCASGNRVGALFALRAFHVDGKSADEALEIGKIAGLTRLEPVVRHQLGLAAPP